MLRKKNSIITELHILFKKLNIKRNDNIFLHSNSAGIFQYTNSKKDKKKLFKIFFDLLLKTIGKGGTLVVPTYNYDFAKGKSYNYNKNNSQVGELSNFFLKIIKQNVLRIQFLVMRLKENSKKSFYSVEQIFVLEKILFSVKLNFIILKYLAFVAH